MVAWVFHDPSGGADYTFQISPSQGAGLEFSKELAYAVMPDTTSVPWAVLKGRGTFPTTDLAGSLLSEAQYKALELWWQKSHKVTITDNLGRVFTIRILELDLKRIKSADTPWFHTWSMKVDVVAVTEP